MMHCLPASMFFSSFAAIPPLHSFPTRRSSDLLEWALMLPLAMPAYVMAYVYTDWLQYTGAVQSALRAVRSEEHTSELQSHHDLVCRLLLEKKKNDTTCTLLR